MSYQTQEEYELYQEYCEEYPIINGYREISYIEWLQRNMLESRNPYNRNKKLSYQIVFYGTLALLAMLAVAVIMSL